MDIQNLTVISMDVDIVSGGPKVLGAWDKFKIEVHKTIVI
jgi:hypothetical protein